VGYVTRALSSQESPLLTGEPSPHKRALSSQERALFNTARGLYENNLSPSCGGIEGVCQIWSFDRGIPLREGTHTNRVGRRRIELLNLCYPPD